MLIRTFYTRLPAIHLKRRKYILQNWNCFCFILQKLKEPKLATLVIWKNMCVVFHTSNYQIYWGNYQIYQLPITKYVFIHFSVPANFVRFVFLDVSSVRYFNFCATLLWLLMRNILKAIWKSRQPHLNIYD